MKVFIRSILLFLMPLIAGIILVFSLPVSREYAYSYRNNVDCNTSWIYSRLFENDAPVDIAFIGSSHTGCGINDSLIERKLNHSWRVSNLAYCTAGRNIHYPLANDLFATKQPKVLIVEVMEKESTSSHQDFGFIADLPTVLTPDFSYNMDAFSDVTKAFFMRLNYNRALIKNKLPTTLPCYASWDHIFTPLSDTASYAILERGKQSKTRRLSRPTNLLREIRLSFPKKYINKVVDLAHTNNCKLIFLYIPAYGPPLEKPLLYDYYQSLGDVWIPPSLIFSDPADWVDADHLNASGSLKLSSWVADKLKEEMRHH